MSLIVDRIETEQQRGMAHARMLRFKAKLDAINEREQLDQGVHPAIIDMQVSAVRRIVLDLQDAMLDFDRRKAKGLGRE